jgi:hypothetical protein
MINRQAASHDLRGYPSDNGANVAGVPMLPRQPHQPPVRRYAVIPASGPFSASISSALSPVRRAAFASPRQQGYPVVGFLECAGHSRASMENGGIMTRQFAVLIERHSEVIRWHGAGSARLPHAGPVG